MRARRAGPIICAHRSAAVGAGPAGLVNWESSIASLSNGPCFLILERNLVVARDVMEALNDQDPQARIVVVRSLDEALRCTESLGSLTAAFLATPLEQVRDSGLGARVKALGGRVVLFDGRPSEVAAADPGWLTISRPFTGEVIQSAARRASLIFEAATARPH
jgi:hypothetical protein